MDQLEVFREQLRRKPGEMQKKEMKKKKEGSDATVKVPAATQGAGRHPQRRASLGTMAG